MNYKQILASAPKYATTASLGSAVLIALVVVFGFLNVIDAVPLLHQALSLTAVFYMYKDRNNLAPKAKALLAKGTEVAQALLPPAVASDDK